MAPVQAGATVPSDELPEHGAAGADSRPILVAVSMAAVAMIAGLGWAMERRHRMAGPARADPDPQPGTHEPSTPEPDDFAPRAADPRFDRLGTPAKKKLIRFLLGLRTFAGASAILCAIAVVVFWAIESADVGASETGLNLPLLAGLLAAWLGYWGCGRLANTIHRSAFHRDHPRFTD